MLLVLDLNVKLIYVEDRWDSEAMQDGIVCLEAVVCYRIMDAVVQLIYIIQFDKYYTPPHKNLPHPSLVSFLPHWHTLLYKHY
jgi:hypothetical protein